MQPIFSIIIPSNRKNNLKTCIGSILKQSLKNYELILISNESFNYNNILIKNIITKNKNPAFRRNLASKKAKGKILVFIDDDAYPSKDWLKTAYDFFKKHPETEVLGGPDLTPPNAPLSEKITDTLLKHKLLGSGVLAHQNPKKLQEAKSPSSLALCNLFVKKELFNKIAGFNEKIGYGGEDTEFLYLAKKRFKAKLIYHPDLLVYHKKRRFPIPYLKQRLKFRINNGKMLYIYPELYLKNKKFLLFFFGISAVLSLSIFYPLFLIISLISYLILVLATSLNYIKKDIKLLFILPPAFILHHAAYYIGILIGLS